MALEGYDYDKLEGGVDRLRREEFGRLGDAAYLDHAGATLYSETQVRHHSDELLKNVFGNPHSGNPSSEASTHAVAAARERVLRHFNVTPETHTVVFTAGATASLKLATECYAFGGNGSVLAYLRECHTSAVGLRGVAHARGVPSHCFTEDDVVSCADSAPAAIDTRVNPPSLVVFPGQSNFCGRKYPLSWVAGLQSGTMDINLRALSGCPVVGQCECEGQSKSNGGDGDGKSGAHEANTESVDGGAAAVAPSEHAPRRWRVLLDAAALVSTSPLDLSVVPADFVALSFYKMFGLPTGLGALIVRNESASMLGAKTYFGGGALDAYSSIVGFAKPRETLSGRLEDGTVAFLDIVALQVGFDSLDRLGMASIQRHAFSLGKYTAARLQELRHHNGAPVVEVYCETGFRDASVQGPVVTFNLQRADTSWVGFAEVERLASLRGVHLRTGCFCNAGACQQYLNINHAQLMRIVKAGYTCGSTTDVVDGRPVGCIRVSFGYMSSIADAEALLAFISGSFLETAPISAALVALASGEIYAAAEQQPPESLKDRPAPVRLSKICVFPIKSCGAFEVDSWNIDEQGLCFDRTWMVISTHGSCISQKQNSKLCLIKPSIDLEARTLTLNASSANPLVLPLDQAVAVAPEPDERPARLVRVCSDKILGDDCGDVAAQWLSAVIGSTCRLVRQNPTMLRECRLTRAASRVGAQPSVADSTQALSLANESQFLLVSEASMSEVNSRAEIIPNCPPSPVSVDRFRGNLVISGGSPFAEDGWSHIRIGDQEFEITAPCQRCQMVCVNQATGDRTKEPLLALSKFRRHHGATFFGQHLRHLPSESGPCTVSVHDAVTMVVGDV